VTVPKVVAAPDKFRGTATAAEVAARIATAAEGLGWQAVPIPVSDGGEGLLACFGGANRASDVTGPHRRPVTAGWRLDGTRAVGEMARASGLGLVEPPNDPLSATSQGTGELVAAAIAAGARDIVVGVGGSASTDGGRDAVALLERYAPFDGSGDVRIVVAADVATRFVDAAAVFAPQKGANPDQVGELTRRLHALADEYAERYGVDVTSLDGSGAAGGLAGGLAALGASIRPGFDVVAERVHLPDHIAGARLVVTGEGRVDSTSLLGKAPFGVARMAAGAGVPCLLVAGAAAEDFDRSSLPPTTTLVSLTERFGAEASRSGTAGLVGRVVREHLAAL
jgi:glycerate kinase